MLMSYLFFWKKPFLVNNLAKVAKTLRMKINTHTHNYIYYLISLGHLVVANSLQVKRLEVNEKSILINETKVAKREASPGVSPEKNHIRYRSGFNFTTEYSPSTLSLKLSRNVIISRSSD